LPSFDNPLGSLDIARKIVLAFDKKVEQKRQQRQFTPLHKRTALDYTQESAAAVKSDMNKQELEELSDAYALLGRSKPTKDHYAAVKALNPEFHETRTRINENSITLRKTIETAADNVSRWNKKTGQGYIGACFALMTEEKQAVSLLDKVRSVTRCLATIDQMTSGLEATEAGKKQIDDVLYPSAAPGTDLRYPVATIIKSLSSFVADAVGLADNEFKDFRSNLLSAKIDLLKASDKFTKALVSSPISSQNFAQDVREFVLKYEGGSTAGGNSKGQRKVEIKASIEAIADMHKTPIKIKKNQLSKFMKEITNKSNIFTQWNESLLVKYYDNFFKQDVDVLTVTVDGVDHPAHAIPSKVVQGASSIALAAVVYSMYVTAPSLNILKSENTRQAASMKSLSKIYYTLVVAESASLLVGLSIDNNLGKVYVKGLAKINMITNLGISKSAPKVGVVSKSLAVLTGMLKIAPIIGAIDVMTNYHQTLSYLERNDTNAALFAGVSIAGGSLLVVGGALAGLAAVGIAIPGTAVILSAAFMLAVTGVIGKLFSEDGQLETWISNGFWGWNEDWLGNPSQYLYWGNIERSDIVFKRFDNVRVRGFEGQLEIAKLANIDDSINTMGISLIPEAKNSEITKYMQREMLDYHRLLYTPTFKRGKSLLVVLPGFTVGVSDLEVVVTFESFDSRESTVTDTYRLLDPRHERVWQLTDEFGVLDFMAEFGGFDSDAYPIIHYKKDPFRTHTKMRTMEKLEYSYYPHGQDENNIVIKGSIEFGVFGRIKS